jgi:hypothetical protein
MTPLCTANNTAAISHAVFSHSGLNHFFGKSECPAILMFAAPTYG